MTVEAFAAAKVNLTLHVTGQRADGYHLLDSLVVFAGVGDRILVEAAKDLQLKIDGPMADGLSSGPENLVLRAAALLGGGGAAITLTKNLPVSSGIGGGSADAAASLRALSSLWQLPLPHPEKVLSLGADVPVCLASKACRMSGVGEVLQPAPALPPFWLVLANPGFAVSTPAVFTALENHAQTAMPKALPDFTDLHDLAKFLARMRNDLEPAAIKAAPAIANVLAALTSMSGCLLARMSGSGATCFGIFADQTLAAAAARTISDAKPDWWVAAAPVLA